MASDLNATVNPGSRDDHRVAPESRPRPLRGNGASGTYNP